MSVRLPNPMSAVVWLAFFIPGSLFGSWLDRLFGIAVFLLGWAVLWAKPSPWEARNPSIQAFKIFLPLEFSCLLSYMYSASFNGIQIGPADCFELLRPVLLGVFVVYLIRHYDAQVRAATDWAMTGGLYFSLFWPSADPRGYVALMTLCYLLFFSRLRLRLLHCAAALLVVGFSGERLCLTAALIALCSAISIRFYRSLVRKRVGFAAQRSVVLCALLLAVLAVWLHSSRLAAPATEDASQALRFIRRSPIFGWGQAGREGIPAIDNQYLLWLLKGGALGAGLILAGSARCAFQLLRAAWGDSTRLVGTAVFLGSVGLMLCAGGFFESFRLFFLTGFFMTAILEAGP